MTLAVRTITAEQHRSWVASRHSVSFLQLPEWGEVKSGWRHESIGWFDGSQLIGAGLVLYRAVPGARHRSLAYLPEGPDIDWLRQEHGHLTIADWLEPMLAHIKARGAFQVKMGPPVAARQWSADTVKRAIADFGDGVPGTSPRISDTEPDWHSVPAAQLVDRLQTMGWTQQASSGAGFGDVQPRYVFQVDLAGKSADDLLSGFNQLWRRNIKKAQKSGVVVTRGDFNDLPAFHEVYVETAARDHFTPRPLSYFEHMWTCLNAYEPNRLALYIARIDDHVAAATLQVIVGRHAWYSYGASTTADRDARPSNALQWRMMQDALDAGCLLYDLRGIADTVDPENHLFGLVQFKVGTGGHAQEYVGEWDYVLRPLWAKAFALARR